jgi:hypothetical protein
MSPEPQLPPLGRRAFLHRAGVVGGMGVLALAAPSLLAACGSSEGTSSADRLTLTTELGGRQLVGMFNYTGGYVEAGSPQRLALAIASAEGPPEADGPATLTVQLARDGADVGLPLTLARHADGVPIGYYPLITTFDQAGTWTVSTELDGQTVQQAFRVEAPGGSSIRQVGQAMVPVQTPTTADARGVTPICTRSPQCPFHGQTLTQALATGAPVALMISTPQYCQTAVCGPVLDLLIEQSAAMPGLQVVHSEVYVNPAGGADPAANGLTDAVSAYGLSFEPSLFVARADGTIVARLDNIFDRVELAQALQAASA